MSPTRTTDLNTKCKTSIDHFTVVRSVPWPLNRREAGGDLVLLQSFLLFMCNSWYFNARKPEHDHLHMKNKKVCNKTRSPPIEGQGTEHTTVKLPIRELKQRRF